MKKFNPITDIVNSSLILDQGQWPNFHDAEVEDLAIWRGDVRPEDNVWLGPVITASFDLLALKHPYRVRLQFHDCERIQLMDFNHQNALFDLKLAYEERGKAQDGTPLTPYITVEFQQAFGMCLTFNCFSITALEQIAL